MFNERLSSKEAKELIDERVKEAETYALHKRLGYGDNKAARWVFLLIVLVVVVTIGLLL
jgi:hypothetical protein